MEHIHEWVEIFLWFGLAMVITGALGCILGMIIRFGGGSNENDRN